MTGRDIKVLRVKLGVSQTEFGNLLGVHYRTIQQWESGEKISKSKQLLLRPYFEKAGMADVLDEYDGTGSATLVTTDAGAISESILSDKLFALLEKAQKENANLIEQNTKLLKIIEKFTDKM